MCVRCTASLLAALWFVQAGTAEDATAASVLVTDASAGTNDTWGVMIDAGSTGTRCFIYSWSTPAMDGIPQMRRHGSLRISPGIASFANTKNLTQILTYLDPVTKFILDTLPASNPHEPDPVSRTTVHMYATAGLRILDRATSDHLLTVAAEAISAVGLAVDLANFQVISGQAEALYSWVAVNVMLQSYTANGGLGIGALDLGGASTQVAYAVYVCDPHEAAEQCKKPGSGLFALTLNGLHYHLFLESYLHFGAVSMEAKVVEALASEQELQRSNNTLLDPCKPIGWISPLSSEAAFTRRIGTSDPAKCTSIVRSLLSVPTVTECAQQACAGSRVVDCECS